MIVLIVNLLSISKRRGKVQDDSTKSQKSEYREKVSSEVLYVGSNEVGVVSEVGYSVVGSLSHHFRCLRHRLGGIGYCK